MGENTGENKINMAVEMFKAYLDVRKIKYVADSDSPCLVKTYFYLKSNPAVKPDIYVEFDDSEKHVHIFVGNFIAVTNKEKYNEIYKAVNKLNENYYWVKFFLNDKNGQVHAAADAIVDFESCVEEIAELILRLMDTIEAAYTELMKLVFS